MDYIRDYEYMKLYPIVDPEFYVKWGVFIEKMTSASMTESNNKWSLAKKTAKKCRLLI